MIQRVWASPRRRRRLKWAGAVSIVGLAVLLSLVFLRNTAPPHKPIYTKGAPKVYRAPKPVDHTRVERRSAIAVATAFLQTAVERRNATAAWSLTEPALHAGFTRREWNSGNDLPFQPFQFSQVKWRPDYSYRDHIGLQVALFPAKREKQSAQVFYLDLRRHGTGKHERWLVSEFAPVPGQGSRPPGIADGAGGGTTGLHISIAAPGGRSPLSAAWLLLPVAIFSLILLLPLWLGIRGYIRSKRAAREYARSKPVRYPLL